MSYLYKGEIAKWRWYEAEEVTSTNDEIKNLLDQSSDIVLSAVHQSKGRGRRGRNWEEMEGNLYFTYTQTIPYHELSKVVCVIAVSLAETVKQISPQTDVKIKWPNDIFIAGKKISGILIENIKDELWAIGIGVNIKDSPKLSTLIYDASSLAENGIILDRTDFLRYYLENFAKEMEEYTIKGFTPIKQKFLAMAMKYQEEITIKQEGNNKKGKFTTLDDNGYLILSTAQGEERIIVGDLFV